MADQNVANDANKGTQNPTQATGGQPQGAVQTAATGTAPAVATTGPATTAAPEQPKVVPQSVGVAEGAEAPQIGEDQLKKREETMKMVKQVAPDSEQQRLALDDIYVERSNNIRMEESYTEESIQEMMNQIDAAGGLLQSVVVVPITPSPKNGGKSFGLIIGFRRMLALKRLAEQDPKYSRNIPVIIAKGMRSNAGVRLLQMLENVGRKDLTPMEEAYTIKAILKDESFTQSDVADMLGKSNTTISNLLSFLDFPEEIQKKIAGGDLSYSNARLLRKKIPQDHWMDVLDIAVNKKPADFEKYVDDISGKYNPGASTTDGGTSSSSDSDVQREPTMLRNTQIEKVYLPFLEEQAGKVDGTEKKYTEKDIMEVRQDTLKTVLRKNDTNLAKIIAPHLEEVKKKEDEEKAQAESTAKAEKFWKEQVRKAEAYQTAQNKPDPRNPDKQPIGTATAYGKVLTDVYNMKDEERQALGFELPKTKEDAALVLRQHHVKMAEEREESQKKREEKNRKKQAEEEAKSRALENAGQQPQGVVTHPVTEANPQA